MAQELEQLRAMHQHDSDGAGPSDKGKQPMFHGFMAQTEVHSDWTPPTLDGGFAFADSYSSDEGGTGLLSTSRAIKPGFVPLGMVPASHVSAANSRPNLRPRAASAAGAQTPAAAARPMPASARRQERMREPSHDEDRSLRNRLPAGMVNPSDLPNHVEPAAVAGHEDNGGQDIQVARKEQLLSLLRTCLSTAKFSALPTEIVADTSAEGAAAWKRAQSDALAGRIHDGQDARSIAWKNAIERAVQLWAAQAHLTWKDFAQIDMRSIFREAAHVTFGPATAAHAMLDEYQLQNVAIGCLEQQSPQQALDQAALSGHRRQRAAWKESKRWPGRRPVAMIDGSKIRVTISGHAVKHAVLDTGADIPMLHQRVIKAGNFAVNPRGRTVTGVTGRAHMMPRTEAAMEIAINFGDSQCETLAHDTMIVMEGDSLPDALFDNETMAALGIIVDPLTWTASYLSKPWDADSPRIPLPLVQPTHEQRAALAALQDHPWPEGAEEAEAAQRLAISPMCFMGQTGPQGAATELPSTAANLLHDAEVGGILPLFFFHIR